MIRRCVEAGLPEPQFAVTDGFLTTVHRAALADHAGGQVGRAGDQVGHAEGQAGQAAGGQVGHAGGQALLSTKDAAMLRACDREAVPGEPDCCINSYALVRETPLYK